MPSKEQNLKVSLASLGCPKNLVDSEKMLADLAAGGCIVGAPMDDCDVIVVNTCGFLASARTEALDVIEEALEHKRRGRAQRVVVAGCLPVRDGERLYELADGIDAIVGANNRGDLLEAVTADDRVTRLDCPSGAVEHWSKADQTSRFRLTPKHTAFLRIAEGCSQRCSFCTIPSIRGPFRSKPPDLVCREARELIADGAVELNVIAQDTTAYGEDLKRQIDLVYLLGELNKLDGIEWVRLMYTYPRRFNDLLIETLADCEHVVPYVDIPLQHISDPILSRMGRGVTRKAVETLLAKLRDRVSGIVLRTTLIVGFPGETDEQFEELLRFVKDFRFDALGVFEFSPEEGTPAADMPGQIPDEVKTERARKIMLAQQQIAFETNESVIDSTIIVLIDGVDVDGRCVGRYYGQAPEIDSLCILTEPHQAGQFIEGIVMDFDGYDLIVSPSK